MPEFSQYINFSQYSSGRWDMLKTEIIQEKAITLTVNGDNWLTFMCTPIQLEALAVGFLYNEGIIHGLGDIASTRVCPKGDNVDIWLNNRGAEKPNNWSRTSGCTGGISSVDLSSVNEPPKEIDIPDEGMLTPEKVCELSKHLLESQNIYKKSGGVHSSALSDTKTICISVEDIGRHNTLDKIAGLLLLNKLNIKNRVLLSTGRISSEMLQKSYRMNATTIISRTSPSSLSIELADKWGITLIGYARRNKFRVYTHPERIGSYIPVQNQHTDKLLPSVPMQKRD